MLAVNLTPLLGAVLIGWLLSVCLHEFLHALVAYLGGDRSRQNLRQLGDPTTYIHPVFSLLIPGVIVLMGGIPLMGGAVLIDRHALRNRWWALGVDLAGVAGNLVLFVILALVFAAQPFDLSTTFGRNLNDFVGTLCYLQIFAVLLNLTPVPPLDGFHAVMNFVPEEQRRQFDEPHVQWGGLILLFLGLSKVDAVYEAYVFAIALAASTLGVDLDLLNAAVQSGLYGR